MQRRKLEELSLMDDFLFNAMLTHPETGEKFTNKILKLLFNIIYNKNSPTSSGSEMNCRFEHNCSISEKILQTKRKHLFWWLVCIIIEEEHIVQKR